MTDLFGSGLAWPWRVDATGRLARSAGSNRIVDSVDQVARTPKGACPMDPAYGVDDDVYDRLDRAEVAAWALANAIEYAEPRAGKIEIVVSAYDPMSELLELRCELTPIGQNTPVNRVLNLFELAST